MKSSILFSINNITELARRNNKKSVRKIFLCAAETLFFKADSFLARIAA
jgi:hypothetical protein